MFLLFPDTQRHADEAAKAVAVTYKEQKPLLLTIDEAIAAKSFFDPQAKTVKKGDADCKWNFSRPVLLHRCLGTTAVFLFNKR